MLLQLFNYLDPFVQQFPLESCGLTHFSGTFYNYLRREKNIEYKMGLRNHSNYLLLRSQGSILQQSCRGHVDPPISARPLLFRFEQRTCNCSSSISMFSCAQIYSQLANIFKYHSTGQLIGCSYLSFSCTQFNLKVVLRSY